MSSYAIRLGELTKDYPVGFWRPRPLRALDGVSLDVEPGEILGFLGPNGAGKTTTLKLLLQLIYPTSGRAEILGRPAGDVEARRRLGYLPELPYFYDNLTAEELLVYFGGLFGLPVDPTGWPYVIDDANGTVNVSSNSELFPLPGETLPPQ